MKPFAQESQNGLMGRERKLGCGPESQPGGEPGYIWGHVRFIYVSYSAFYYFSFVFAQFEMVHQSLLNLQHPE